MESLIEVIYFVLPIFMDLLQEDLLVPEQKLPENNMRLIEVKPQGQDKPQDRPQGLLRSRQLVKTR